MSCRFCDIAQHKVQDYVIWENNNFLAFLDLNSAKEGHCMLVPKKHVDYFFDLDDNLYHEMFFVAKKLSEPLRQAMDAKRIGMAVVGFDVPHAHLHLVPLHGSNELFDPSKFRKLSQQELKNTQNKLLDAFKQV